MTIMLLIHYTNKKEADCENKLCFIVVDNGLTISRRTSRLLHLYLCLYKGDINI